MKAEIGVEAWAAVLRTRALLVRRFEAALRSATGLPLATYDILLVLKEAKGRMTVQALGELTVVSRTRVSRIVDEMEATGLVVRRRNPVDRRSSFVELTARGRTALRRAAPIYLGAIRAHFTDHLTLSEARTIQAALAKVLEAESDHSYVRS